MRAISRPYARVWTVASGRADWTDGGRRPGCAHRSTRGPVRRFAPTYYAARLQAFGIPATLSRVRAVFARTTGLRRSIDIRTCVMASSELVRTSHSPARKFRLIRQRLQSTTARLSLTRRRTRHIQTQRGSSRAAYATPARGVLGAGFGHG
jgi:hypothetical protein